MYEDMQRKSNSEPSTSKAMVERGRSIDKTKGKKAKGKCWYCNKSRHIKKDCWKRKESKDNATKESKSIETSLGMLDEV